MLKLIKAWLKAPIEERDEQGRRRMTGGKKAKRGTPQGGVATPPTMLQNAPRGARFKRALFSPEHDLHPAFLNLHALDQRADDITLASPVDLFQPALNFRCEVLQPTDDQLQLVLQYRLIGEFPGLFFKFRDAFPHPCDPRLKLLLLDQSFGVRVNEASYALPHSLQLTFNAGQVLPPGLRPRLQTAAVLCGQPLRVCQQRLHLAPDRAVQQVGPHLQVVTHALAAEPVGVRPEAAVVGVVSRQALLVPDALTVEGVPAALAADQTLEQIPRPPAPLPRVPLIGLQLFLDRGEHLLIDDRRHRDRDPFLARDTRVRVGPSRLQAVAALRAEPGAQRTCTSLAESCRARISRILQDRPDDAA